MTNAGTDLRPTRTYGGVAAEDRVAARRARLIEAGRRLFGRVGVAGATVKGTCEEAGLNQRYFYESFATVEDLAVAVAQEISDEAVSAALGRIDGEADPERRLYLVFRALADFIAADPSTGRIMFKESAGNGTALAAWRRGMLARAASIIAEARRSDARPPRDASRRARDEHVAGLVIAGGAAEAIVAWLDGEVDATPDELARSLALAVGITG